MRFCRGKRDGGSIDAANDPTVVVTVDEQALEVA